MRPRRAAALNARPLNASVRPAVETNAQVASGTPNRTWKRSLKLSAQWIVGGMLVGAFGTMFYGGLGSIVVLFVGILVGLSGALAHNLFVWKTKIDQRHYVHQVLVLWAGASVLPAAFVAIGVLASSEPGSGSVAPMVFVLGGGALLMALVEAAVVCWVVSYRPA